MEICGLCGSGRFVRRHNHAVSLEPEHRQRSRTAPKLPMLPIIVVTLSTPVLVWANGIGKGPSAGSDDLGPMLGRVLATYALST
jgi:hypothetical protein